MTLAKRLFDLVCALTLAVLLSPLLAGLAVWLRLTQGGPVLYAAERVGQGGSDHIRQARLRGAAGVLIFHRLGCCQVVIALLSCILIACFGNRAAGPPDGGDAQLVSRMKETLQGHAVRHGPCIECLVRHRMPRIR